MSALSGLDGVRATARAMTWFPPVAGAAIAVGIVAANAGERATLPMQAAAILLSSGAGYAFDDPAFEIVGAAPVSMARRRLRRLALILPAQLVLWVALLAWMGTTSKSEAMTLCLMFGGMLGLVLAVSGVAQRRSARGAGGLAGAIGLFVLIIFSSTLPPGWRPLPMGDIPGGWAALQQRWGGACVAGLAAWAVSSRDPAARWALRR